MPDAHTLKQELQQLANELGKPPTQAEINRLTDRSHSTYVRAFGGWNDALDEAVGDVNLRKNKDRVELDCDNPDCEEIVEKLPGELEQSENHYCSQDCHYEHKSDLYCGDGNPQSTLEEVECRVCEDTMLLAQWERERYNQHYCSDCWGNTVVTVECDWCGDEKQVWPSHAESEHQFCSLECHGRWATENRTGENHPRWRGGYGDPWYGPNWRQQRRRAIERDGFECMDCGIVADQHWDEYDEGLSVHHKIPIREFFVDGELDHEEANCLSNLVTLCRPCHSKREGQ